MNFITNITMKSSKAAQSSVLTEREYEVLLCIAWGLSNKEVGDALNISPRTVEIHRAHLIRKLNARNSPDAVRIAMNMGIKMDLAA